MLEDITKVLRPEIPKEAEMAAKMAAILSCSTDEPYESLVENAYKILDIAIKVSEVRQEARLYAENKRMQGY